MSVYTERAAELFGKGFNCSQAVFAAFCDKFGMDEKTALKAASGLGGGVGRMMAIEAALAGADLYIAVLESDMPLAKQVEKEIKAMKSDARINIVLNTEIPTDVHYELLMNACPVGMYPKTNACPVPDEVIKASGAVFDVIYNPRETLLMQKAKAMGKNAVGGMAMLVWQAVSAHEIWDGDEYTDEEVQSIIDEMEIAVEKDFK